MEKTKVYIGVYRNDYHESLFCLDRIDSCFLDIITNQKVSIDDVDFLVPYDDIITCKSNLKVNIIKMYDFDRNSKISLDRVFLGNVFEIENTSVSVSYNQTDDKLFVSSQTTYDIKKIHQNALLYVVDGDENMDYSDLINIENGELYKSDSKLENGTQYVIRNTEHLVPIKKVINVEEVMIEKGKLLEKYRKYRGGKL